MKTIRHPIWAREEYGYPGAGKFIPHLTEFVREDDAVRPAVLVAPGGAYVLLQPGEADYIAIQYADHGYRAFVLTYTNDVTLEVPVRLQPLRDISRAVRFLRRHASEFRIDPARIVGSGYSAGGHLVGSLAVLHGAPELASDDAYAPHSNRLDAAVLNYPKVSFFHAGPSGPNALATLYAPGDGLAERLPLERHLTRSATPMFLVHGISDSIIPVQEILMFADACRTHGIPFELHLLQGVDHGFSTDGATQEMNLAAGYVYDQLYETVRAMDPDRFRRCAPLYGALRQGMPRDEFDRTVLHDSMMRLYLAALGLSPADVDGIATRPGSERKNTNASHVIDIADRWIRYVLEDA